MTGIQQRIADIIERHLTCECGDWAEDMSENCSHAAAAVVSELGLTRDIWPLTRGDKTRYVTKWVAEDQLEDQ